MAGIDTGDEDETQPEFDAGICFPIQDGGFSYRKTFTKLNNKKLSGTVDFRLKTNVTKALLKENKCDERKLQKSIAALTHDQHKQQHAQNYQQMNFTFLLKRRRESWHKEDLFRVDRLNLPQLSATNRKLKSASIQEVYRMADNVERKQVSVPLLPVMYGETEPKIVEYKNHTYLTKQPIIHALNPQQQRRYDRYRGSNLLASRSVLDRRFERLSTALSDAKLSVGNGRVDRSELQGRRYTNTAHRIHFPPATTSYKLRSDSNNNYNGARAATTLH